MPHITTAMESSVRRGLTLQNYFFDSLLGRRSISGEVSNVQNAFSSWDNCMSASFCKWPVIAVIIVGGLIIFSIVSCIIRCACCGMSCCCSCFSFLKCCDCCGGCCDGKKNKKMKHLDEDDKQRGFGAPPPNQGYQAPAPMMNGGLITSRDPIPASVPQFAQFEVGKNGLYMEPKPAGLSEDALPPMPSWDTSSKKHVEDESNAVELGNLNPATGQKVPLMTGAVSPAGNMPTSPANEYGQQPGQAMGGNGYMGINSRSPQTPQNGFNNNMARGSPGPGMQGQRPGYGPQQGRGFGQPGPQDSYGNDAYGRPQPQRRPTGNTARQFSNDSSRPLNPGRQYSDNSYDEYQAPPQRGPSRGPQPGQGYDNYQTPPPARGPSRGPPPGQSFDNYQTPPPQRGPSRGPQPGRSYDEYRNPNAPPQRGPSRGPSRGPPNDNYSNSNPPPMPFTSGPERTASPGPINNSGFDFGSGDPQAYARPPPQQQMPSYNNARGPPPQRQPSRDDYGVAPSYRTASPALQEPAYPGYKPYTPPPQQGVAGGIPASLSAGGGRGRPPPQGWDPVHQ